MADKNLIVKDTAKDDEVSVEPPALMSRYLMESDDDSLPGLDWRYCPDSDEEVPPDNGISARDSHTWAITGARASSLSSPAYGGDVL